MSDLPGPVDREDSLVQGGEKVVAEPGATDGAEPNCRTERRKKG